jgi:hypothetical protein
VDRGEHPDHGELSECSSNAIGRRRVNQEVLGVVAAADQRQQVDG